ncbi:MAG: hypothetical protein KDA58_00350 [Planctomycetaceae bacterium]|nr:hypothetical protein [Planctomycetaceae bacterium]
MHRVLLSICFVQLLAASGLAEICKVRVILFVPADLEAPVGHQERLDQTVKYTEQFFLDGLKRWGHEGHVSPFVFDEQGHAVFTIVRGEQNAAAYEKPSLRVEAIAAARTQLALDDSRQIWWVFVYKGDPPQRFADYRGGFDPATGGWSVCNFGTHPGKIDLAEPLGSPFLVELTLKGMIHELGHAFQLPHIGPRDADKSGNTLMGPTHFNYRRVTGQQPREAYLSEAAAAMICRHPAFRGIEDGRGGLPKPNAADPKVTIDSQNKSIRVRGQVAADPRPAFAVVANHSDLQPGEYWTKHFVAPINAQGDYEVTINELAPGAGELSVWYVFDNGAMTGNGRLRGPAGAIKRKYGYANRQWKLVP